MGAVINIFSSLTGKRRLGGSGSSLGPVPYLLGGGKIYFQILWSRKKKTARELFFWAFVFWNAAVLNVPLPPPVRRTHQFYKPWSDLVSPLKAFIIFYFILSTYLFIFLLPVSGLFCSLSLEIKEPQAVILASPGRSVPLPKACTTLLGTTDLSFFVRVIPPFCVNYPLLTYLHQRLFLISVLFCLLNSQIERGPISCCHSRIIYT